ncbi:MAG: hypothetical protein JRH06_17945, partial [Deltaproteobacteria bacterium]|nr:hypothetical protein [Deltaproteobacteria bacterium]
ASEAPEAEKPAEEAVPSEEGEAEKGPEVIFVSKKDEQDSIETNPEDE